MKRIGAPAGFTIVELLIVLAVSGGLFTAIVVTYSGSQQKAQFQQATQNLQSRLQQVINDVSNGYYPSIDNIVCSKDATGQTNVTIGASKEQGTNEQCVFLGKVVQFGIQGSDPEQYGSYGIAAQREAADIVSSKPALIPPDSATEYNIMDYGLTTKSLKYSGIDIGAFAIVMQMGTQNGAGGYESGNQRIDLVPIVGSALKSPVPSSANSFNNFQTNFVDSYNKRNPTDGIKLCVQDGDGSARTALVTIGGAGHDLTVNLEIKSC